jgi:hypothetical protein
LVRIPVCIRLGVASVFLALAVPWSSAAWAQGKSAGAKSAPATKSTVAIYTEGPKSSEVREHIIAALPAGVEAIEAPDFRKELGKAGQKVPAGLVLAVPKQRKTVVTRFGKAAEAASVKAAIIGYVQKKRNGTLEVILLWVKPGDTEPSLDKTVPLDKTAKDEIAKALESDLASIKPEEPKPETTEPKEDGKEEGKEGEGEEEDKDKEDDAPAPGDRIPNVRGDEIFNVGGTFDLGGRFFSYNDGITRNLRDYDVFGSPGFALDAEVYPLTTTRIPVLKDLGIFGDFRINFLGSETNDGKEVSTSWNRFDVGLRYRLTFTTVDTPDTKLFQIGFRGNLGRDGFVLTTDDVTLAQESPSVDYFFLRGGIDTLIPLGPVYLKLFFDYLGALGKGDVYDRFSNELLAPGGSASIGGIDLGGGAIIPLGSTGLEIRATAEYIRWFYAFEPVRGNTYIAGGALDQYVHLNLGVGYVY